MITNLHSTILLICGLSGSGKDTFAKFLASGEDVKRGLPAVHIVTSYTNRPMRVGETQGKEHMFVEGPPAPKGGELMAYCKYGNYEYWTFESQFRALPYSIYIVDEASLISLKEKSAQSLVRQQVQAVHGWPLSWAFSVKSILVKRDSIDVESARTSRDSERDFSGVRFDKVIDNNGTLEQLQRKALRLRNEVFRENGLFDK